MDRPEQLRKEFERERAAQMEAAYKRGHRSVLSATAAGGVAGLVAVALTATLTRRELFWHSFLIEATLCAGCGYLLARWHGGVLKGVLLFGGAYLFAFLLRALGLDPSVILMGHDLDAIGAAHGNLTSLVFLILIGGAFGHVFDS